MKIRLLFTLLVIGFISCNEKNKCIKRVKSTVFIQEYITEIDSCNTMDKYSKIDYFQNDTILMSGFNDRIAKQGKWSFYDKGELITKGLFKDSNPIDNWSYKNFSEIDWTIYQDNFNGFQISIPKNWTIGTENNTTAFFDSKDLEDHNLKISVTIAKLDGEIEKWINGFNNYLKSNDKNYNIKFKKLDLIDIEECYEFEYNSFYENIGEFTNSEFLFIFNGKAYVVSSSLKTDTNRAFSIIKEQIMFSFKMDEGENKIQ